MAITVRVLAIAFVFCGLIMGCGGGSFKPKPTALVTGEITLNGAKLPAGSQITFLSADGVAASSEVSADGTFMLKAGLGINQISVSSGDSSSSSEGSMSPEQKMHESQKKLQELKENKGKLPEGPKTAIPLKYGNPTSSGIKFEVKEGQNQFSQNLKE